MELYYRAPFLGETSARVLGVSCNEQGELELRLDRTIFYPGGGGQPPDEGFIADEPVLRIEERKTEVVYVLARNPGIDAGDEVRLRLDWELRFDHMQHHTGQHILSQSFRRVVGAETISFHLGSRVTVDLDKASLADQKVAEAEDLANETVWKDIDIERKRVPADRAREMALRKHPDLDLRHWRLVKIGDFDISACGGTHLQSTGQTGVIKVTAVQSSGPHTRVAFVCGKRAFRDWRRKEGSLRRLKNEFDTGVEQLPKRVKSLREENARLKKRVGDLGEKLARHMAERYAQDFRQVGEDGLCYLVALVSEIPVDQLKVVAGELMASHKLVFLAGVDGSERLRFYVRAGKTFSQEMGADHLLRKALSPWGSPGGGGKHLAQGGGVDRKSWRDVKSRVEKILRRGIN